MAKRNEFSRQFERLQYMLPTNFTAFEIQEQRDSFQVEKLVYAQSQKDIVDGTHSCTKYQAVIFAALQLQVTVCLFVCLFVCLLFVCVFVCLQIKYYSASIKFIFFSRIIPTKKQL